MLRKVDYIIVGSGLAGSCLAIQLKDRGASVLVVKGTQPTASRAAAGLFNPITGRHMVKTWMADELFPYLIHFYQNLEKKWNCSFLNFLPIYKPFPSFEDQNTFMGQQAENAYAGFLDEKVDHQAYAPFIFNDKQGFQTLHSGFMDVSAFLDKTESWLKSEDSLLEENFNHLELDLNGTEIRWKEVQAKGIVFCEGMSSNQNPLFSWVPINASKGEVLQVKMENFNDQVIFNKQVFIVPAGNKEYKVGSTYYWKFENDQPTETGRKELSDRLADLIRIPFEVSKQWAGIRPASRDRRPYLGKHPEHPNVFILNGLGAKGVSLAPYFSEMMAEFILNGTEPESSVNITRLIKKGKDSR